MEEEGRKLNGSEDKHYMSLEHKLGVDWSAVRENLQVFCVVLLSCNAAVQLLSAQEGKRVD